MNLRCTTVSLRAPRARFLRRLLVTLSLIATIGAGWPGGGTGVARAEPGAWVPGFGGPGTNGTVYSLLQIPGGDILVGGSFTAQGNGLARYAPATGVWTPVNTDAMVQTMVLLPGGDVVVGCSGHVTETGALFRYNPTSGARSGLSPPNASASLIFDLLVLPDGDLVVAGNFEVSGGQTAIRLARYNPTSGAWMDLAVGFTDIVRALTLIPGGDLIVGGDFNNYNGVAMQNVARVNPATGAWTPLGAGVNVPSGVPEDYVTDAVTLPDGDVIFCGVFSRAGGQPAGGIARYRPTTGAWSPLNAGVAGANVLAVLPGGDFVVGGNLTSAGGVPASRVARYNPTTGYWSALDAGVGGNVFALSTVAGGDLLVGGSFATANGVPAGRIARYHPGSPEAPVIVVNPSPAFTNAGGSATFAVYATANPGRATPIYQWRRAGVPISTAGNPSAATPVLVLSNVQAGDLVAYDCIVSDCCGGPSAASTGATLSFGGTAPSPCPADLGVQGGGFGHDGLLDNNDFISFITLFFDGC